LKTSKTFAKNLKAYRDKKRFIINKGGSRSSKTYSILQLLYIIAKFSEKPLIIHVVSYSSPHLSDGVITDFEQILVNEGENLDQIRIKNPHRFTINKTLVKFIAVDTVGKALGGQKDILFINEANNMSWEVVHQLIQRTTQTVFIDYNPSREFWIDTEGISSRENAIVLHSTFLDNVSNLNDAQITEFKEGKKKHDEEIKRGIKGHWFNWWRVYGLGLRGVTQGTVFPDYKIIPLESIPEETPFLFGIDWGYKDPFTLTQVFYNFKEKKIYVHELVYETMLKPSDCLKVANDCLDLGEGESLKYVTTIADNAQPSHIRMFENDGFNIYPCVKERIEEGVSNLHNWEIYVTEGSLNAIMELNNYKYSKTQPNRPIDAFNHCIDAVRYCEHYIRFENS
jgi:phage terminase large subunit